MAMKSIDTDKPGVKKELQSIPNEIALMFLHNLRLVAAGEKPELEVESLNAPVGRGALEIKVNGSPAYRCIYSNKDPQKVVVLHVFAKTTNGPAHKNYRTAKGRLK